MVINIGIHTNVKIHVLDFSINFDLGCLINPYFSNSNNLILGDIYNPIIFCTPALRGWLLIWFHVGIYLHYDLCMMSICFALIDKVGSRVFICSTDNVLEYKTMTIQRLSICSVIRSSSMGISLIWRARKIANWRQSCWLIIRWENWTVLNGFFRNLQENLVFSL